MTELDLAWAAGFIDGEGCFCLSKNKDDRKRTEGYCSHRASLAVSNTCADSVRELQRIFKCGTFTALKRLQPNHKPQYRWQVRDKANLIRIILSLLPYFRTKRAAAEVCIAFCIKRAAANSKGRGRYAPYSQDDVRLVNRCREINKRNIWKPKQPKL